MAGASVGEKLVSSGGKVDEETVVNLIRPSKEMGYVSLHHHSTYSYLDGFALPKSHAFRAAELGMPALALTEHGNISSHVKLEKACNEFGVKPLYGCELYTGAVGDERTQRKNHLTILAESDEGYRSLLRVVSQGWSDFYYEPTVSGATLAANKKGLVVLSGCTGSLLATSLIGGKNVPVEEASYQRGKNVARRFKKTFGDAYYLEVQMFPELENVCRLNVMLEQIGKELGIKLVATGDVHYTRPEHNELQQILHSIGRHKSLEQLAQDWGYDVSLAPPLTDALVYEKLRATGLSHRATLEAVASTLEIAERCTTSVPHMDPIRFPIPPEYRDREDMWRSWLKEGWRFRGCHRLSHSEAERYRAQLAHEMKVIGDKDFIDYFLFTSDIVKFAKDHGIAVGPARGSAAASIVCWLLRITEVNPMLFDTLLFERFIDPTRPDLPDIDLDFDDERRHEVFEYAANKYGREYTGRIGTATYFKSKNSLDDIATIYRIPKWKVEKVKEVLVERSSGDLRSSATIEDTVEQFAQAKEVFDEHPELWKSTALEGNIKGMGIHAAGLVVATRPIRDICAVYVRTDPKTGEVLEDEYGNPREVVSFDKYDAEEHNLLKMDILGLTNMGLIRRACEFIGMDLQELYDIPLDDPETIRGFKENDVNGIFQFDGWATRSVNESVKPDNFNEIADVNALSRPGPLHSGSSRDYVDVKFGRKQPDLSHPLLDPIVAKTYGQIVYQEQILRIVREIGNFEWTHAAYIRRIISKKLGEQEFNRQKQTFVDGAIANGVPPDLANEIWGHCITAGAYAFNAAHSVSYSLLAFWTMWLKRNHAAAFYAAALHAFRKNKDKYKALLRDAEDHGVKVLPPDLHESGLTWVPSPTNDYVRAGFMQLPGWGEKTANAFLEYRAEHTMESWDDAIKVKGIGKVTIGKIKDFCANDDPFGIYTLQRQIQQVKDAIYNGDFDLPMPTHTTIEIPSEKGKDVEVIWIGQVHDRNLRNLYEVNQAKGKELDLNTVKRPDLDEWVIMHSSDHTERVPLTVDRFNYPKLREAVWSISLAKDLVLVRGVKRGFQSNRGIYVWDMWVIDMEEDEQ